MEGHRFDSQKQLTDVLCVCQCDMMNFTSLISFLRLKFTILLYFSTNPLSATSVLFSAENQQISQISFHRAMVNEFDLLANIKNNLIY